MKCPVNYLSCIRELAEEYDHNMLIVGRETTFDELGMDSYEVVDFLMKVEERFDIVFDDDTMFRIHSVDDLLDIISESCKEEISNA